MSAEQAPFNGAPAGEPLHVQAQRLPLHEAGKPLAIEGPVAAPVVDVQEQGGDIDELERMFAEPAAEVAPVVADGARNVPAVTEVATGRHASTEIATDSGNGGRHRQERFLTRNFNRLANFASKRAEKWGNRRTTREFASDQVERGRNAARRVGNSVVTSAQSVGANLSARYENSLQQQHEDLQKVRGAFITAGRSARLHKDILVGVAKNRLGKMGEGIISGVEKTGRVAKLGGEVLLVAGVATTQLGVMAAEGVAKGARKAGTVSKELARDVADEVVDLRAANAEFRAKRADPQYKAEKQARKHARRAAKAQALRTKAEQQTLHRMSDAEIAEARAQALNR